MFLEDYDMMRNVSFIAYNMQQNNYQYDLNDILLHHSINESMILTEVEHISYATISTQNAIHDIIYNSTPRIRYLLMQGRMSTNTYWSDDDKCSKPYKNINEVPKHGAHKIFVSFYYENTDSVAYVYDRVNIKDNDDIDICVNLYDYIREFEKPAVKTTNLEAELATIMSVIAHELQHVLQMYVDPRRNVASSKKNKIYEDIVKENHFGLSDNDYVFVMSVGYLLSPMEQDANLQGVSKYIENNFLKEWFKNEWYRLIDAEQAMYIKLKIPITSIIRILIVSLMNLNKIRILTHIKEYFKIADDFVKDNIRESDGIIKDEHRSNIRMMVIGYYMFRCGMLDLMGEREGDVNKMLSEEEVRKTIDDESYITSKPYYRKLRDIVYTSVHNNYLEYEKKIYYECERQLDKFKILPEYKRAEERIYPNLTNFDFLDKY